MQSKLACINLYVFIIYLLIAYHFVCVCASGYQEDDFMTSFIFMWFSRDQTQSGLCGRYHLVSPLHRFFFLEFIFTSSFILCWGLNPEVDKCQEAVS